MSYLFLLHRAISYRIRLVKLADDDGSGIAALIELARIFSKFKGRLKHAIQFCFFNAKEVEMCGSMECAKHMKLMVHL